MIPYEEGTAVKRVGFPRVSGGDPAVEAWDVGEWKFSPRERG